VITDPIKVPMGLALRQSGIDGSDHRQSYNLRMRVDAIKSMGLPSDLQ